VVGQPGVSGNVACSIERREDGRGADGSAYVPWNGTRSGGRGGGLAGYEQADRLRQPTLERMARLAGALGNPQRACPVIHLTGTNRKGSTAAMTAGLLPGQGLRAGTYTSPHRT
jgi:hypothetical protein